MRWDRTTWPWVTSALVAVTAVAEVLQVTVPGYVDAMRRDPAGLSAGHWWRVLTPLLTQTDGVLQFVVNIVALAVIGYGAERLLGRRRWVAAYLAGGIVGQILGYFWEPPGGGTSVAVFGVAGALVVTVLRGPAAASTELSVVPQAGSAEARLSAARQAGSAEATPPGAPQARPAGAAPAAAPQAGPAQAASSGAASSGAAPVGAAEVAAQGTPVVSLVFGWYLAAELCGYDVGMAVTGSSLGGWVTAVVLLGAGSMVYQGLRGRAPRRADVVLCLLILAAAVTMATLANHHGPAILAGVVVGLMAPAGTREEVRSKEGLSVPGGSS